MKKLIFMLMAIVLLSASCKKKPSYTCKCQSPYGTNIGTYNIQDDYSGALSECNSWQSKWNATTAYVGTQCTLQ